MGKDQESVNEDLAKRTPPFPEERVIGERLYRTQYGHFVQFNGEGNVPGEIADYERTHGEMPPYMPLPDVPVEFNLGDGYGKSRRVQWPGKGPVPPPVLAYVRDNGALPQYNREVSVDFSDPDG